MQDKLDIWIREINKYNHSLHLVSNAMLKEFKEQVQDCMYLLEHMHEPVIADLGTGSGFPGIPYKIMYPDSFVYLIDRSQKKCIFLKRIIEILDLKSIEVLEADPLTTNLGPFNAVIARSFSPHETLEKTVLKIISSSSRFYYIYTGTKAPCLNPQFHIEEEQSRICKGHTLNLVTYKINPL